MSLPDLLTLAVIFIAAPLTWFVAALLWRLSRTEPRLRTLRAHAVAALSLALIVTVFAVVFVNNGLVPPPLNSVATQIITRGTLLVVSSTSAAYWLLFIWRSA